MALLERTDVGDYLFGEVALVFFLLDVGSVEAPNVPLIEYGRHRPDRFQLSTHPIELAGLEHPRRTSGSITILLKDVPSTEDDVIEIGERLYSLIFGERPSVRFPTRIVPICVSDPIGFASPLRIAHTPAIVVVATAPSPTSRTPSLPCAGAI